ncbi:MAG: ATP-binding protein [Candidatus Manganitrophus sp.]|nr:ATP-binding protein [Candidatus Manganitrophus sp.]
MGFVHVDMRLEDYTQFLKDNHRRRLVTTFFIFTVGIGLSFFLSVKYTQPIDEVVQAAKKIASGDLSKTLPEQRHDEIGELTKSFNEMVDKLRRQRELEERLRQAEQLSALGQMASGIAHEIRNPLNLINLSIDHLKAQFPNWDTVKQKEAEEIISNVKVEIYRLNQMIENFLNYGKPLRLHFAEVCIDALLQEVLRLARHKAGEQKIEFILDADPSVPKVTADPEQLKTCMINIILNAIQAMPHGGRLEIQLRADPSMQHVVDGEPSRGSVVLTFQDTGVGIDEEDLAMIFEPYFTTKKLGIGLGLAITKRIIQVHGGNIDVQSELEQGTRVTIHLPVQRRSI